MRTARDGRPAVRRAAVRILLSDKVPTDDEIIRRVRAASGSEKFGPEKLSWYKSAIRNGRLPGMGGVGRIIKQKRAKIYRFKKIRPCGAEAGRKP